MMKRTTFSVVFFCKKTKLTKKGTAPIYARITTSGRSTEIYTQCRIEPEHWNQRLERCMLRDPVSTQINGILATYRTNILAAYDSLIKEGKTPDCFAIKHRLEHAAASSRMFLAEFSGYYDKRQKEVGIRLTQLTANKYHRVLRYLTEYVRERYGKEDVPLSSIDYEFLDGFNTFLQTAHRCHHNGAINLLDCVKNFTLYCLRNEWLEKDPFRHYKLKEEHNKSKDHLTKSELDPLLKKPLPNERLARIRDVFSFCCLTGLAFTDVDHLKAEHIRTDENGVQWIHKPREKTSVMSRIPLLPHPIALLRKYERDETCRARGKLLPVPSNAKMNAYLKEIAIEYGMPIDIIAKILGHTNTNMTRRYAKISEANISREMKKIGEMLSL